MTDQTGTDQTGTDQTGGVPTPSILKPRILIPFLIVTLIWGSTWIVIKDQLGVVPASWSVTYRFLLGGTVMLAVAAVSGNSLRIGRSDIAFVALLSTAQFALNFNFVYEAEHHITSGLVAVVFALLFLPNALMARVFLGHKMTGRFIAGSLIAVAGIALLFANEARGDDASNRATLLGMALTFAGVLSASTANVMIATQRAQKMPIATLLGWSMLIGAALNACFAWTTKGPPQFEMRWGYVLGIGYLGIIASALAFSLYFRTIRDIGPAKAAYSSVAIPVIAMAFSTVFEAYQWTGLSVAGSAIAMIGMVIALGGKKG
jgi:drug/metabolite transporter (DMT)-like permease